MILDHNLTFKPPKVRKMFAYVMRRSKNFVYIETYLYLYASLVRSRLEFGLIIWNPDYTKMINVLESVQKKFLRYVHYKFVRM